MIRTIARSALKLDLWLQDRLGRPYNLLLGAGLTFEIVRRLIELPKRAASLHRLVPVVVLILMECALLIHQLGALSHQIERRRGKPPEEPDHAA